MEAYGQSSRAVALEPIVLMDARVWTRPNRMEALLKNVFEVRTICPNRKTGFSKWLEGSKEVFATFVFDTSNRVESVQMVDETSLASLRSRGQLVWQSSNSMQLSPMSSTQMLRIAA